MPYVNAFNIFLLSIATLLNSYNMYRHSQPLKVVGLGAGQQGEPVLYLKKDNEVRTFDLWEVSERWR